TSALQQQENGCDHERRDRQWRPAADHSGNDPVAPRALSISHAAVIRPMWLNACGKLPSSSSLDVSTSSASRPRSLAYETSLWNSSDARSTSPARASADTSQNEQITNVPSSP